MTFSEDYNNLTLTIEQEDKLDLAEECGLNFTGEFEEGEPQFTGNNKAWSLFNDGGI